MDKFLIKELVRLPAQNYTIILLAHKIQQAARVSNFTAFFPMDEDRAGMLVENGPANHIFTNPHDRRTEDTITGRFD